MKVNWKLIDQKNVEGGQKQVRVIEYPQIVWGGGPYTHQMQTIVYNDIYIYIYICVCVLQIYQNPKPTGSDGAEGGHRGAARSRQPPQGYLLRWGNRCITFLGLTWIQPMDWNLQNSHEKPGKRSQTARSLQRIWSTPNQKPRVSVATKARSWPTGGPSTPRPQDNRRQARCYTNIKRFCERLKALMGRLRVCIPNAFQTSILSVFS